MKVLFFGDIFGRPGREAVKRYIDDNAEKMGVDFIVANAENSSSGRGPTAKTAQEIIDYGIDVITLGDHCWDQKDIIELLDKKDPNVLRPLNYPVGNEGTGYKTIHKGKLSLTVVSLLGRVFTTEGLDSPFQSIDQLLKEEKMPLIIDFHAEATSEKEAMGNYLDGRISALLGTHTHVQTADEGILKSGTAYISDVGMCGPVDSVIGVKKELSIERFLTGKPLKFEVADGDAKINAVLIEIDESGHATSIERINEIY